MHVGICTDHGGLKLKGTLAQKLRAAMIENHFSTRQGVDDDRRNIICLGGPLNSVKPSAICDAWAKLLRWDTEDHSADRAVRT